jgi:hypothetical protein
MTTTTDIARAPAKLRLLEQTGGFRYYFFDTPDAVPLEGLANVVLEAWRKDYANRAIFRFDDEYLKWLMPRGHFFGIWVTSDDGTPAGCELAIDRTLVVGGKTLRASYVTLLTVAPELRGKSIAQNILRHLTRLCVEERGSDVLVSVFDENAAGQPTVNKFLQTSSEYRWPMMTSPPFVIWAAAPDLREVDKYERFKGVTRVALAPGIRSLLEYRPGRGGQGTIGSGQGAGSPSSPSFAVGFAPDRSLPLMYASFTGESASELSVSLPEGSCSCAYHYLDVMRPGLPDKRMCQIQLINRGNLDDASLLRAVRTLNDRFFGSGSICAFFANSCELPSSVLLRAGYLPTDRKVRFAIRGPADLIASLGQPRGKWYVDIL